MILTAHQPAYLPWLGLFHKIALADRYICLDMVQYSDGFINRNRVKTANGPVWLTVPIRHGPPGTLINDIAIDNSKPWQRKHWKTLQQNYGKAPYFKKYADFFELVYTGMKFENLAHLNRFMLAWFLDTLDIKTAVDRMRNHHFAGAGSGLILDMCQQLGADRFLFGSLGESYCDSIGFAVHGVWARFQYYLHPVYPQRHMQQGFVSHLSVVDLLFNCGPQAREIIMSGNAQEVSK